MGHAGYAVTTRDKERVAVGDVGIDNLAEGRREEDRPPTFDNFGSPYVSSYLLESSHRDNSLSWRTFVSNILLLGTLMLMFCC